MLTAEKAGPLFKGHLSKMPLHNGGCFRRAPPYKVMKNTFFGKISELSLSTFTHGMED